MTDQRERREGREGRDQGREGRGQKWQKWFKGEIQRAKKVVSDSPGLVDFAIGLVILVLNLPERQVLYFAEIQIMEGL